MGFKISINLFRKTHTFQKGMPCKLTQTYTNHRCTNTNVSNPQKATPTCTICCQYHNQFSSQPSSPDILLMPHLAYSQWNPLYIGYPSSEDISSNRTRSMVPATYKTTPEMGTPLSIRTLQSLSKDVCNRERFKCTRGVRSSNHSALARRGGAPNIAEG